MKTFGRIGDLWRIFMPAYCNNEWKPTRITLDLSEDKTFYYTRIYIDGGYIECKSGIPSFVDTWDALYDVKSEDPKLFTLTIPEEQV